MLSETGTQPADDLSELNKRESKKQELGRHTLSTLARWGYAGASMRTIAEEANVSLGIIHYYFRDKIELICYSVQIYKVEFARKILEPLTQDSPSDVLIEQYTDVLTASLEDDAEMHRLWFDIRSQAMFDDRFQVPVDEIEQSLIQTCETLVSRLGITGYDSQSLYSFIDGLFRYHMKMFLSGETPDGQGFRNALKALLIQLSQKA